MLDQNNNKKNAIPDSNDNRKFKQQNSSSHEFDALKSGLTYQRMPLETSTNQLASSFKRLMPRVFHRSSPQQNWESTSSPSGQEGRQGTSQNRSDAHEIDRLASKHEAISARIKRKDNTNLLTGNTEIIKKKKMDIEYSLKEKYPTLSEEQIIRIDTIGKEISEIHYLENFSHHKLYKSIKAGIDKISDIKEKLSKNISKKEEQIKTSKDYLKKANQELNKLFEEYYEQYSNDLYSPPIAYQVQPTDKELGMSLEDSFPLESPTESLAVSYLEQEIALKSQAIEARSSQVTLNEHWNIDATHTVKNLEETLKTYQYWADDLQNRHSDLDQPLSTQNVSDSDRIGTQGNRAEEDQTVFYNNATNREESHDDANQTHSNTTNISSLDSDRQSTRPDILKYKNLYEIETRNYQQDINDSSAQQSTIDLREITDATITEMASSIIRKKMSKNERKELTEKTMEKLCLFHQQKGTKAYEGLYQDKTKDPAKIKEGNVSALQSLSVYRDRLKNKSAYSEDIAIKNVENILRRYSDFSQELQGHLKEIGISLDDNHGEDNPIPPHTEKKKSKNPLNINKDTTIDKFSKEVKKATKKAIDRQTYIWNIASPEVSVTDTNPSPDIRDPNANPHSDSNSSHFLFVPVDVNKPPMSQNETAKYARGLRKNNDGKRVFEMNEKELDVYYKQRMTDASKAAHENKPKKKPSNLAEATKNPSNPISMEVNKDLQGAHAKDIHGANLTEFLSKLQTVANNTRPYPGSEEVSLETNPNRQHSDLDTTPTRIESNLFPERSSNKNGSNLNQETLDKIASSLDLDKITAKLKGTIINKELTSNDLDIMRNFRDHNQFKGYYKSQTSPTKLAIWKQIQDDFKSSCKQLQDRWSSLSKEKKEFWKDLGISFE